MSPLVGPLLKRIQKLFRVQKNPTVTSQNKQKEEKEEHDECMC
jgi:hypothetical protein